MSPKRSVVAPVPTTVARHCNHHKRRLANVPVLAGIARPKLQQPYSRACVLKPPPLLIQSTLQNPMVSSKLWEILEEESRTTVRADGGEEESETVARTVIRTRTTSRRRVMSTVISVSASCGASDEWLAFRDVSILAGTPYLAYLGYQKTLPADSRTLPDFCCEARLVNFARHTDGYGSHNLQQRPVHVWRAAPPWQHTDCSPHTQVPRCSKHGGKSQATKIPPVSARLEIAHSRSHTAAGATDFVGDSIFFWKWCQ